MLDIWSSADGSRWQLGGVFYEFLQYQPEIAELNGKLFAISGFGPDGCSQDVWSSENGVDWLLEGQTNDSQTCSFMKVVEFNDKLWAIGTFGSFDDIWSSDDGLKWVLETDDAAFPARNMGASVTVSDGKLWVAGGYLEGEYFNDVWSSVDGVTWVEEVGNANFPPSTGLLTNSEGKLYYQVLGKDDAASDVIEIWSSYDGIYWVQEVITPSVSSRVAHALTDFDGRIWMLGGADWSDPFEYDLKNDYVWSSPDGSSWTLHHIPKPSLR
ncbi:MAG: hypothetical protein CMI00_07080 [Oceanospirillaceae bacterium]|nr:hypothetical protein [Oceanospirillaceae bacterium]